jgi:hypothetical protein
MATKSKVDTRDNREIILTELQNYGGYQKSAGDWQMIVCPFHSDRNPSLGVYVSMTNPQRIGHFHCFGCDEKGGWNKLAEQAGLEPIKEWKNKNTHSADLIDKNLENSLLGNDHLTIKGVLKAMGVPEAQPWPDSLDWRGFSGKVVHRAGGYIAYDNYNDSIQVVFIVKYAGAVRGGVKAKFEKARKGQTSYIAMSGPWVNKYGLLFYEQAKTIITKNEYNFCVIVEGPRDALRLLINGIPAIAVLGASTMTKAKAMMLSTLAVDSIYAVPDNDQGGDTFWKTSKKALHGILPVTRIKLPKTDSKGKVIKIDPGNMSLDLLDEFISLLEEKSSFNRRKELI